jgi:hypothetical protein
MPGEAVAIGAALHVLPLCSIGAAIYRLAASDAAALKPATGVPLTR